MSRLIDPKDVVPVELGGGDVVYIKRKMSFGDKRRLAAAAARLDRGGAISEATIVTLELNVVSWTGPGFTGPDGKPVEVTRERLDQLDDEDAGKIVDAINEQNPKREAAAGQIPFGTESSPLSPTADPPPIDSSDSASSSASGGPSES